ncbi:cbb3-type cytochrome c oxidase subunit 3 [Pseudohalocynthiibacter aestuariivivens]|jgi:cytochrome c oxidase cbb3-type subunit IV|uniref:Cbb3-type cytochrome c oxidase subunit 3 n=1 Tax=Pseudohalocynthiibacter aestuariivivens TaxID=1591409 RepID=A0ABV5JI13_9RHOB|nr:MULTISPECIES: cbb3-type cytochrome c oxidase subunit 3 [Pseudohalocynthiibacter]MBS9717406.1 cbb3-type cytochrome c oxidase subunit 3 [Pseudohalocynthiibacter aestuariivivens]MCK0102260.1 cbb3-type cytochrome c oxidase subunit 3 [Pseudohalocynthiibacter sp. F2068]
MDLYSLMREFADSWMLLFMFTFFIGCIIWVFRPGSKKTYEDTANIPFRHEDKPASDCDADRKEART